MRFDRLLLWAYIFPQCEQVLLDRWLPCPLLCGGLGVGLCGFTEEGVGCSHAVSARVVVGEKEGVGLGGGLSGGDDDSFWLVFLLGEFFGLAVIGLG